MKQLIKSLFSIGPPPATTQRTFLELQLPIALLTGTLLLGSSWLHLTAAPGWLFTELFVLLALVGIWLLRTRVPLWLAQAAVMLFVLVAMWSGVSVGGEVAAAIATGVVTLLMAGLSGSQVMDWVAVLLGAASLLSALLRLRHAHIGVATLLSVVCTPRS